MIEVLLGHPLGNRATCDQYPHSLGDVVAVLDERLARCLRDLDDEGFLVAIAWSPHEVHPLPTQGVGFDIDNVRVMEFALALTGRPWFQRTQHGWALVRPLHTCIGRRMDCHSLRLPDWPAGSCLEFV